MRQMTHCGREPWNDVDNSPVCESGDCTETEGLRLYSEHEDVYLCPRHWITPEDDLQLQADIAAANLLDDGSTIPMD